MRIAILGGTGKEGRGLAPRWARAGHEVRIGSRDEEKGRTKAAAMGLVGGDHAFALEDADVAVLTVPYPAHAETLKLVKPLLAGRVLLDLTVPLQPPQVRRVHLPPGQSAAVEGQALLGDAARVVAGLHHVSSVHLLRHDEPVSGHVLMCSDDADALAVAMQLVTDLGFSALDAGPLQNAVALEALTSVLLHLNARYGGHAGLRIEGLHAG
jgi:NADPH-dependent F420 reductase